ncbi:MAG: hypothetical protein JNK85_10900 [Verrucomicrobiales bacterium]|nr:hypothetical protein [Verrucomicrobiales bacterium]
MNPREGGGWASVGIGLGGRGAALQGLRYGSSGKLDVDTVSAVAMNGLPVVIAALLLGGLLAALEISFRLGRRAKQRSGDDKAQMGTIQAAVLGLLGLLLGFSFAGAAGRMEQRQGLVVAEANAIGTAFLRADLLPVATRGSLKALLFSYTQNRVRLHEEMDSRRYASIRAEAEALHNQIWAAALRGVEASPQNTMAIVPAINEVIDLHLARLDARMRHLPGLVVGLLVVSSLIAVGTVGYGCGLAGRRNPAFTTALALLVASVLWVVIDLDYPRVGVIRMNQDAMLELQATLEVGMANAAEPPSR